VTVNCLHRLGPAHATQERWRSIIEEDFMLTFKTILHPTDFSERSALAMRLAGSLARDHGARLIVVHVAVPPPAIAVEGMALPPPALDLKLLRAQLQQVRPEDAKVPVEHRLVEGDAAAEILRLAGEMNCDLIVMGTHGRTWLSRMLMGSVAEQVVRKASCPVLTVKAQRPVQPSTPEVAPATAGRVAAATK